MKRAVPLFAVPILLIAAVLSVSCTKKTAGEIRIGLITPLSKYIERCEPWLTLYGLRIIYDRNR